MIELRGLELHFSISPRFCLRLLSALILKLQCG